MTTKDKILILEKFNQMMNELDAALRRAFLKTFIELKK
jgi:hypothetical protein